MEKSVIYWRSCGHIRLDQTLQTLIVPALTLPHRSYNQKLALASPGCKCTDACAFARLQIQPLMSHCCILYPHEMWEIPQNCAFRNCLLMHWSGFSELRQDFIFASLRLIIVDAFSVLDILLCVSEFSLHSPVFAYIDCIRCVSCILWGHVNLIKIKRSRGPTKR